jgi:hypothetical protein
MFAPKAALILASVVVFAALATTGRGACAQQADSRRQAIAYLRDVNTIQLQHFHGSKRYATPRDLLVLSPLPPGWTFTMVVDRTGYLALVTGLEGEAFTTSDKGLIYAGEVLR